MLSVNQLSCSRGERTLFAGLDMDLQPGEWLQVSGVNGAGKTTLLRTLVGLCEADEGIIHWAGQPVRKCADDYRAALIYLGHHSGIKDDLTPIENLQQALAIDGIRASEGEVMAALGTMGLRSRAHLPARVLSAGQKRRTLQTKLLLRPARLWVLDEPFAALDAAAIDTLCGVMQTHLQSGGMVILTSHQPVPLPGGKELVL
jgi:heme exporter protein A